MNVVKEINRINDAELSLGLGASWHDEYKDSAYIFVGGLNTELTEGDVITMFSQYGEVMDVNMPRDKETGKPRGFGFIMYEDQRSTILAVDNLNGANVLDKILRVDHVKNYKQPKIKGEDGEWIEPEEQSLNAKPQLIEDDDTESDSSGSRAPSIDPEDPMREYLLLKREEEKSSKKTKKVKSKAKHKDETPEERRKRKERKREKKARKKSANKSNAMKDVEALLSMLDKRAEDNRPRSRSRSLDKRRKRPRSPSPDRNIRESGSRHASTVDGGNKRWDRPQRNTIDDNRDGRAMA